jgi:hypothetical protein
LERIGDRFVIRARFIESPRSALVIQMLTSPHSSFLPVG